MSLLCVVLCSLSHDPNWAPVHTHFIEIETETEIETSSATVPSDWPWYQTLNGLRLSPQGAASKSAISTTDPALESLHALGIDTDMPRNHSMALLFSRTESFKNWTKTRIQKPLILAEAVFYYTGKYICFIFLALSDLMFYNNRKECGIVHCWLSLLTPRVRFTKHFRRNMQYIYTYM